jgi:hypothetical protein
VQAKTGHPASRLCSIFQYSSINRGCWHGVRVHLYGVKKQLRLYPLPHNSTRSHQVGSGDIETEISKARIEAASLLSARQRLILTYVRHRLYHILKDFPSLSALYHYTTISLYHQIPPDTNFDGDRGQWYSYIQRWGDLVGFREIEQIWRRFPF